MIRYFCDKCNKELIEPSNIFQVDITPPEIRRWTDDAFTGSCILCRDCVVAFNKWMGVLKDAV